MRDVIIEVRKSKRSRHCAMCDIFLPRDKEAIAFDNGGSRFTICFDCIVKLGRKGERK